MTDDQTWSAQLMRRPLEGEVGGKAWSHLMRLVAASTAHGAAVLFFPVLVRQQKRNIVLWQVAGFGTGMTRDQ